MQSTTWGLPTSCCGRQAAPCQGAMGCMCWCQDERLLKLPQVTLSIEQALEERSDGEPVNIWAALDGGLGQDCRT